MKAKSKLVGELRGSLKPGKFPERITAEMTYGKRMRIGKSTAPEKRHSPNQETWRDKFKACIAGWNTLTPEQKEPYNELGKSLDLTGYQVYISQCLLEAMATEVVQSNKTLLHATVHFDGTDNAVSGEVEVVQPTAADLKATVTQASAARTVTGNVTSKRGEPDYTPVHKIGSYTTAQTDATLWDPAAGKKFVITDVIVSTDTKMDIHLEDGTTKKFSWHLAANGGLSTNLQTPYVSIAADNLLTITSGAAGKVDIEVFGYEI